MIALVKVIFLLLASTGFALGKPDLSQPLGRTVAQESSRHYDFIQREIASVDGQRRYRLWIAKPRRLPPPSGYPVLYLLDGNAALGAITPRDLAALDNGGPPLLVFIGYATELRFDVTARAYDYTPPLPGGQPVIDDIARSRLGGGADDFLDLLEQRIKPMVKEQVHVDIHKESLWGHSYGGLLVLHALFTRPHSFQNYIAADPSVWWQEGFIFSEEKTFSPPQSPINLWLMKGGAERKPLDSNSFSKEAEARRKAVAAVPPDSTARLAERLSGYPGMVVNYQEFPQLSHGAMLPTSLLEALKLLYAADSARRGQ